MDPDADVDTDAGADTDVASLSSYSMLNDYLDADSAAVAVADSAAVAAICDYHCNCDSSLTNPKDRRCCYYYYYYYCYFRTLHLYFIKYHSSFRCRR